MTAGELYRLARELRELALAATRGPTERPAPLGVVAIADDIAHHDGTSIGEITERTGLAQSLVSQTVARLREAGIVETASDERDRRRTRIRITASARSDVFASRGARGITESLRERFPDAPESRIVKVESLLDRLAAELTRLQA